MVLFSLTLKETNKSDSPLREFISKKGGRKHEHDSTATIGIIGIDH